MALQDLLKVLPFVFIGVSLVRADGHDTCVPTDAMKRNLAAKVDMLVESFDPIMSNSSLTEQQKSHMVLHALCNSNDTHQDMKMIEEMLINCSALAQDQSLTSITLGELKMTDLFIHFANADNFCECLPAFMQAMMMKTLKMQLMYQKTNAQYPVFQLSQLCSSQEVKTATMKIEMDKGKCQNVWKFTDFLKAGSTTVMKRFVDAGVCDNFNNTLFMCAVDKSADATFKTCISDVKTKTGDKSLSCMRNMCVKDNFDETCGAGNTWYKWAVEMLADQNKFEIAEDCGNGVATTVATSGLLLVALFTVFFL